MALNEKSEDLQSHYNLSCREHEDLHGKFHCNPSNSCQDILLKTSRGNVFGLPESEGFIFREPWMLIGCMLSNVCMCVCVLVIVVTGCGVGWWLFDSHLRLNTQVPVEVWIQPCLGPHSSHTFWSVVCTVNYSGLRETGCVTSSSFSINLCCWQLNFLVFFVERVHIHTIFYRGFIWTKCLLWPWCTEVKTKIFR